MKIFLPLVTWIVILSSTVHSQQLSSPYQTNLKNSRFRGEVFFLNLEDGYFGCQVNESTDYLQVYDLSKLCDGNQDCFLGSDELNKELKCTNDCDKDGTQCTNGVCLNGVCHCNDGYGGCNCNIQDENECKFRPCDVFAHCTNTLGSFTCTCFPGYRGDGIHCEDIDECQDPAIAARCVENAECCNLPAHFLCKCKDGYEGDGEVLCTDIDECRNPTACGANALCINTPGNYTCECPEGFYGSPYDGCQDIDECTHPNVCGPGAICTNLEGGYRCDCPPGYEGDGRSESGCLDYDECARSPCGRNAECLNTDGSFKCLCPDGYSGDPGQGCEAACVLDTECTGTEVCQGGQCVNPCLLQQACGMNARCDIQSHLKQCSCPPGFTGNADVECVRIPVACSSDVHCDTGYTCRDSMCLPACLHDQDCALNEKCLRGNCMLTCRVDNDCFLGHICLHNKCVFGCHTDDDCSASESCRNDKCINPCVENPCGPNAVCSVSNHRAVCNCQDGMVPNPTPQVGCVRTPALECYQNRDCPNGLACYESSCRPLCADDNGCISNERCQNGVCKPLCRRDDDCRNNEVCLELTCVAGCRSDQGCPGNLACVGQQCVDICNDPTACGTNAFCIMVNHRKQCTCPDGLVGNPEVACKPPFSACVHNEDCKANQLCYGGSCQGKCRNDQNCLADERCLRGTCRTVCNTDSACAEGQICENRVCQVGCRSDLTCPNEQACMNKKCKNPCETAGQCGQCANCIVVNHGVQCSCPNGFIGDGLTGCQLPPQRCNPSCQCDETKTYCADVCTRTEDCVCGQVCSRGKCRAQCGPSKSCPLGQLCERGACAAGCKSNSDCATDNVCLKGQCTDPCNDKKSCGRNALCTVSDHRMLCYCPDGYEGEPSKECIQFECHQDEECESNKRCDNGKCRNPCLEYGACGVNAQCRVVNRKPQCSCPPDFLGNPAVECQPADGGCANSPCGANSKCTEVPGGYECSCMDGCMGDAHKGCVCEGHLVNACYDQPCGVNAACRVLEQNEAQCYCPEDFPYGDAYVQCYLNPPQHDCRTYGCEVGECVRQGFDYICRQEIGCASSDECPAQRACVNTICVDPCSHSSPCGHDQECQVIDHQPVCSKVCECQRKSDCHSGFECDGCHCRQTTGRTPGCEHCPQGTNCDPTTGACIKEPPGTPKRPEPCHSNNECIESEACYMGLCQDPCEFANICAPTAKCAAKMHRPICSCPIGHEGNPTIKCSPADKSIECTHDSDCTVTEACINERCQHPCDAHNPCAQNAVCINTNHVADCSCVDGYQGNAFVGCQPETQHTAVCQYNEDCPPTKLCDRLNRRCINPCQEDSCGENAECVPVNHGIECRCLPGFLGNAYIECSQVHGCRADSECDSSEACINGKCSSPCRCGAYALCDIINHRGICKCPAGYAGDPKISCSPPSNPCEPNPCGINALCELDNGNPICYCPKGLTGNPFKNCIPEGDECSPNPCGPNSGCRLVNSEPICFCLPEYEGQPPNIPCELPSNPCDPSPCGPNTQCAVLSNGFSKCTCLPGYVESPNTIRGCIEPVNPCDPNPCGLGAICDSSRNPVCFCPDNKIGNPFRICEKPAVTIELCKPGPCGRNADCYVASNREECYCRSGYIGDPYEGCREPTRTVCEPNPCGPNAQCVISASGQSSCICADGLFGEPASLIGCHGYECQIDADCPRDKACMGFKCYDPCPGACGPGANCRVEEHHPVCSCNAGLTGNPGVRCYALDVPKKPARNPCIPSPCGINSECKLLNNRAVCSCLPGYLGDPQSGCHPECDINSDCSQSQSCINHKCIDPCGGTICGINAICNVRQHTPICTCLDGFTGDAFLQCVAIGVLKNVSRDPCTPSPCGPNDVCSIYNDGVALCDPCFGPNAQQNPRCRPECLSNSDCPFDRACLGQRCLDPCPGSCGHNAICNVYEHNPICSCPQGLYGNPYEHCSLPSPVIPTPSPSCEKLRCGANAECKKHGSSLACVCRKGYFGDPFIGCRPECVLNTDCSVDKSCVNSKCVDACVGVCGINAVCHVVNHSPVCICSEGYTGNAFLACNPYYLPPTKTPPKKPVNPCNPSPCGPNSRCLASNDGSAACSCLPNFKGAPPVCQPECVVSSECVLNRACINNRCADPCPGTCGVGARCEVLNHNVICSCEQGFEGDPFVSCSRIPMIPGEQERKPENPCVPSPCGPNSICQIKQGRPVCSCIANYVGSPPYCRPECTLNSQCPADKACIQEKCQSPCTDTCGHNARCTVIAHSAHCSCELGFEGDAFVGCSKVEEKTHDRVDPCYPSPCGENAVCAERNGAARCTCIEPYIGDPYTTGCRPECVYNSECSSALACIKQHCRDPCIGTCGTNAECAVVNHVPTCSCAFGFEGNPFVGCKKETYPIGPLSPCEPSPCGPNSICRVVDGRPTCSCQVGYFGAPPTCRPECVVSSECTQNLACINQKCIDPCVDTCGFNAKCDVVNHNPICTCPLDFMGDPFEQCIPKQPERKVNPCIPSPCGPNAECREIDNRYACNCAPGMFGAPPNCRPECVIHQDCPSHRACIRQRCEDPCVGACGFNAICSSQNHKPICSCIEGHEGDPYAGCNMRQITPTEPPRDPCNPSPCGPNAVCRERNNAGSCSCLPEYFGDPYTGCRPECVQNTDCDRSRACINNKCQDPCPGVCGINAECRVLIHAPKCSCYEGYTGDPYSSCAVVEVTTIAPAKPCQPSPCGPYSQCRESNGHAVCSCIDGYIGAPPSCKPECVVSSECPQNRACISQKCDDPCRGACGNSARCQVVNHNPICTCPPGMTGDPFITCTEARETTRDPLNPCVPSPCGPNSLCREIANQAACSCQTNYVGRPPNCRPECTNNDECQNHLSCQNERCVDPCPGSCGNNAICKVVQHNAVCSCIDGFEGDPITGCNLIQPISPKQQDTSPCKPSPCGPHAECRERNGAGACYCHEGFEGNAYDLERGCRRECEINDDCALSQSCVRFKCVDPCENICGEFAICSVDNHVPTCNCPSGYTGDPFFQCKPIPVTPPSIINPCVPSPCGPNSICRSLDDRAVCLCQTGFINQPPNCRPECVVSSECAPDRACVNKKCVDPCQHTCGTRAICTTKNHSPICTCPRGMTGDPFVQCSKIPIIVEPEPTERPPSCVPSPCGPNSKCQIVGGTPACSCLVDFIGAPPNCRPECVLNSECGPTEACINQKCRDPCPGSCGFEAKCHVLNHVPICNCIDGFTGDPFIRCSPIPTVTEKPKESDDPCDPNPCGPNADCLRGECRCQDNYQGNPYDGCRPECTLSADCARDKACMRNRCVDPCPGTCGLNAICEVLNHIPSCSCLDGYEGDPFNSCRPKEKDIETPTLPCSPSPCGPNSQCRDVKGHAVCSCVSGYVGTPPQCRPECIVSSECSAVQACVNKKCVDPCAGACGINARCEVVNHSPICGCPPSKTGDPFKNCIDIPTTPVDRTPNVDRDPCNPSPCGANSICKSSASGPSCQCLPEFFGSPPNCRPECIINPDCASTQACINNKCRDPCPGSCGINAECRVISHTVSCSCPVGFAGNAFVQCVQVQEQPKPCEPSPCGTNAECIARNEAAICKCFNDYIGNPYESCRPECVLSSDCATDEACIQNKCKDPCPGICGSNAQCYAVNHVPNCVCSEGYTGDPFSNCQRQIVSPTPPPIANPCQPSPCGPNSKCREANNLAVCSCLDTFIGAPPNCKPECTVNAECPQNKACHKFKCANPCAGTCGINAKCEVINHNPICSCPLDMTGDPFARCYPTPITPKEVPKTRNPCLPSPCGLYSECRVNGDQASCSCLPSYIGAPPNCRPECIVNTDCPSDLSCIAEKCRNPCEGSCGVLSECRIQNHIAICTCRNGFTGDPFTQCVEVIEVKTPPTVYADPCDLQPCGANTECNNGICTCLKDYQGDPNIGCRPECTVSTDCSPNRACLNKKCVDPCPGTCGQNAECNVLNHIPTCSCPKGYTGDPFIDCRREEVRIEPRPKDPCQPSPCGPNSICHTTAQGAVCACQPGMLGSPPACKPECIVSSECSLQTACMQKKCIDPCPGACGQYAKCQVINHNPICTCNIGYTGDPFTRCYLEERKEVQENPCVPTPCGPNSECKIIGDSPACSCAATFIGKPPNCRPECSINSECTPTKACIRQKCADPCIGSCGFNARCTVANHMPICSCEAGYTGDPFTSCQPVQAKPTEPVNPCRPSPCGANANCRVQGNIFTCDCINDYIGNPYEGCRPECVGNSECSANRACIRSKCADPCIGTCGVEAICTVNNHIPMCSCPHGYTGNAFAQCSPIIITDIPTKTVDPCYPTPCGINTICKTQNGQAVCECLPGFFGNPIGQGCRPECTLSSDCPKNRACVNSKCIDPCPGVCGYGAECRTVNHNPICNCPSTMVGNPFVECHLPKQAEPLNPCVPSPCLINGICRVVNNAATCTYPECITNEDCARDRACTNQKCRDPCINACGLNALCNTINHKAICTCPVGFYGSPYNQCVQQIEVTPIPRPECVSDNDCSNDKACVNEVCKNPCELSNICGQNARCHVQLHRPLCVCNEGYTGNAFNYCYLIGCRSDEECPATEACINKQCTNPCPYTQCGTNAVCRTDYNHKARCYCPDGYRGNPLIRCERPECTRDDECAFHLACRTERCEDPCNCGVGAQCRVDNHQAKCRCPPGYIGNPLVQCDIEETKIVPQCTTDADCSSKLACFNGECKNPCGVTKPCGVHAICSVVDTLPLRTMLCECERGYIGDADVGCRKEPVRDHGCQSNEECPSTDACRNTVCVNPCTDASPCSRSAECLAEHHRAICSCPQGTQGDPFVNCYQPTQVTAGCTHDSDCAPTTACINKRCQDPCAEANPCAGNAECRVVNYRPICYCPAGWGGDPQVQCYKPECKINADCPYDKACISNNCVNPCIYGDVRCGNGAQCAPQNHQAVCICPPGTQGNPFVSCITGHCQYNEDCADHEACDRLNRVCRPVCDDDTCTRNAVCIGRAHQPHCECNIGYIGNPFVECSLPREPPKPKPECVQDSECPSKLACINQHCANPCATPNVCTPQQTCTVLDTVPLRTMICKCPSDTVTYNSGNCVPIRHDVITGCQHNEECGNTEICQRGICIDACRLEHCGVNAQCRSGDHYADCSCARGYEGNPRIECHLIIHEEPKTPGAECIKNDDCPNDKTCRNERCTNPCVEDSCGRGAYCHVQNREAICRCPPGYTGNPKINCIPPVDVSTIGCKSNADCPLSESCINERCINPCNCGTNAECLVRNHHPICYCKSGYSGNAQFGCIKIGCQSDDECALDAQCINHECVNPCLISDPCAVNAECYGRNHRPTCRCPVGLEGDPFVRCLRLECHSDYDCASHQACIKNQCVNPCNENPCAQNAICQALQHKAVCRCPEYIPLGNPYAYCERRPVEPVCQNDGDCPSRLACIDNKCQNPCLELSPCSSSSKCSVLDSIPVRTMVCECPEAYVPDAHGDCKQIVLQSPPGCSSDADCNDQEACINRQCRNPCNCGTNAVCNIQNHRATCSCQVGYEGNPYSACRTIGCRIDSECDSGKACINSNCINPCLVNDPCGINAECYTQSNRAMCRCKSGYRGNAYERCRVIGCLSNSDCPSDKMCQNEQCVNPCVYHNTCSPRAECRAQNHMAVCRCPIGFLGNPYVDCTPEPQPTCKLDTDCPSRLACINDECVDPCLILEPCNQPAECQVTPTSPVRTMICVCPDGYVSSGSGTCKPTKTVIEVGGCISDSDCDVEKSCLSGVCRDPCNCGVNAECRIKDHKPVCTCRQGYEGNPEFECSKVECAINSDCPSTHACRNQLCVPACQGEQCGRNAECIAVNHRAVCECIPGFRGNARISCTPLGCRTDDECPTDKACVNSKCENPCDTTAVCAIDEVCKVYQHRPNCACPPGTIARRNGCEPLREIPICRYDGDCHSQTACIRGECVNPCNATEPCGVNAICRVLDTVPVRTMICECLDGYTGNAAVQCDKRSLCVIEKGFVRDIDGQCVCPPGSALDIYEYCTPCIIEQGFKIDETGHCVCALERGMVIDERGRCICPIDHGYRLTSSGECIPEGRPECETDSDCADNRYCNLETKTCDDPCLLKTCGLNAFCNTINHRAQCVCIAGYTGNPDLVCNHTNFRTDFPQPEMVVSCLADGVQVEIHITEPGFNGVLYVKGHSKDEECRRVVNLSGETVPRTEIFRVHFGSCGMQAVKDIASFVLVIQKHPKLVTYKAQAYNIKCVYQTGEKNVTIGFNVSMLTTAGTIANTGPPPICQMRIITYDGKEINSAEIGDNLKLQVDVEPATIYGGFARSCIAKTMEDNIENEYIVTDENGCATDTSIFGDWEYNPDTNSLLANFNAFKFPSSDNIRFQCNIRVCFGKCQPVNCRGYNAFGRRRRRSIADNSTADSTAVATNTGMEGQLREEITISSNAILTFEKRSGNGANDANIKPAAQRVEDICVSMVGLIIALVITALLALVAVAVAVSCWLMAYRRRPKTLAPLPHPPEFPNPLFTNPEAAPEPTPDYLS